MSEHVTVHFDDDQFRKICHLAGEVVEVRQSLETIHQLLEKIMATIQEVKDAAAAEKAEVKAGLDALAAQIQALKDQIAAGTAATPAQLDEVLAAIQDIFTPTPPAPAA